MAIFGIGTDVVKLERVERSFSRHGEKFVKRILAESEVRQFQSKGSDTAKIAFLAKRFAAKEAISKALGTGMQEGIDFKNIIITTNELGKPEVDVVAAAEAWVIKHSIRKIHLSISDEQDVGVAFAVAEI